MSASVSRGERAHVRDTGQVQRRSTPAGIADQPTGEVSQNAGSATRCFSAATRAGTVGRSNRPFTCVRTAFGYAARANGPKSCGPERESTLASAANAWGEAEFACAAVVAGASVGGAVRAGGGRRRCGRHQARRRRKRDKRRPLPRARSPETAHYRQYRSAALLLQTRRGSRHSCGRWRSSLQGTPARAGRPWAVRPS